MVFVRLVLGYIELVAKLLTLVSLLPISRSKRKNKKKAISDKAASDNVFLVTRAEENEIVRGHASALESDENPIIGTLVEELADYSQRFARANLTQQEVDVYLDNIEVHGTEDVLAEAPDMEPGKDRTEDGVELTHTVEGMQVSF